MCFAKENAVFVIPVNSVEIFGKGCEEIYVISVKCANQNGFGRKFHRNLYGIPT